MMKQESAMNSKQKDTVEQVASLFGCDEVELKGETFRNLFDSIEKQYPWVNVYWGCWSDSELDAVI
jgi:hypothetical protein